LEGNSDILTNYLETWKGRKPKIAYFGDYFIGDIHYAYRTEHWDPIAVIEEMAFLEEEYK